VDITKALEADPKKTVAEAQKWAKLSGQRPWNASEDNYAAVQERVTKYVKQGRLGIFGNAYWGSKAYKLTPEQNLIGLSHYLDALELQKQIAKAQAIFGGKNPHPQSIVVGGVTCVQDIKNPVRVAEFKDIIQKATLFTKQAYLPDVYMAGTMYADEALAGVGAGIGNFMSFGDFNLDDLPFYESKKLFPSGVVMNKDLTKLYPLDQSKITEDVTHAWYEGTSNLHPYEGVTNPKYTGFKEKKDGIAYLDTQNKYSWIKSPLYDDERMEVGPLARMVVGVAAGDERITKYVTTFLKNGNLPTTVLFSTIGRTAARAIETELMCDEVLKWCDELASNVAHGDLSTWTEFDFDKVAKDAQGYGMAEAPRGGLGHWVKIKDGKVMNYQAVVPSTWNAAPRDYKSRLGAYESSLVGTKVVNPDEPLEIIRTVHSFDPCIACAVHIVDTNGKELSVYKVDPLGVNRG
jgi:quinone-reactive Ni/Fe-hydrogenase large subunit